MGVYIHDIKLVIITGPKTIRFNLKNKVDYNLNYEIDSIIKYNRFLAKKSIKSENKRLMSKYKHGNYILKD